MDNPALKLILFLLFIGVDICEAGLFMYQVGFLCDDKLIIDIDDELLILVYDVNNKRFVNVIKLNNNIAGTCREIIVDVNQLYSTKYYPRVYYTIYKLEFSNNVGYLLERYDGTTASSRFYPCSDVKNCGDLIEMFESL